MVIPFASFSTIQLLVCVFLNKSCTSHRSSLYNLDSPWQSQKGQISKSQMAFSWTRAVLHTHHFTIWIRLGNPKRAKSQNPRGHLKLIKNKRKIKEVQETFFFLLPNRGLDSTRNCSSNLLIGSPPFLLNFLKSKREKKRKKLFFSPFSDLSLLARAHILSEDVCIFL